METKMKPKIKRQSIITCLSAISPQLMSVTLTEDMGYEFGAIVPSGIIFPEPGMLLNYSNGSWPPDSWAAESEQEIANRLEKFLLEEEWSITAWDDLSDEELEEYADLLLK